MQVEQILINKNALMVDFHYVRHQPDSNGIVWPHGLSLEQLFELGYSQLDVSTRPDDYQDTLYFRNEQAESPYIIYTKKPASMLEQHAASITSAEAQRLLDSTDFLFTLDRHAELLATEPEREASLRQGRAQARETIRAYKAKYQMVGV